MFYYTKEYLRDKFNDLLLWLLRKVNKSKDRNLASRLHDISLEFDPRGKCFFEI